MATVHFIQQGKGGVGKSVIASFLYQVLHHQGKEVAIFATGLMVQASLEALPQLQQAGIDPTIVNVCSIKPLDEEGVAEVLKNHSKIVTAEEHNIIGGLGSAISDVSVKYCPRMITKIGIQDRFAESGPFAKLLVKYHLDAQSIVETIKKI